MKRAIFDLIKKQKFYSQKRRGKEWNAMKNDNLSMCFSSSTFVFNSF